MKRMDMTKNSCYEYQVPGGANRQDDNMDSNYRKNGVLIQN